MCSQVKMGCVHVDTSSIKIMGCHLPTHLYIIIIIAVCVNIMRNIATALLLSVKLTESMQLPPSALFVLVYFFSL